MEAKEIRKLLDRYYEGESTLVEEKQLHSYFAEEEVPADLEADRNQFLALTDLRMEDPSDRLGYDHLFQKIDEEEAVSESHQHRVKLWGGRIAASVAIGLVGFLGGIWYGQEKTSNEVVALREEFQNMRHTMLLTQLQRSSASERIQAIQASQTSEPNNQEVSEALLLTVGTDPNVNVRLAAIEALNTYSEESTVRTALAQVLNEQEHPLVQIAIINQLVSWGEKEAVPELQKLVQSDAVEEIVKQQAEIGISQLLL
ncbi:MAG: HEAT repeat domain-containing protein [Bacteroidota bacterium]